MSKITSTTQFTSAGFKKSPPRIGVPSLLPKHNQRSTGLSCDTKSITRRPQSSAIRSYFGRGLVRLLDSGSNALPRFDGNRTAAAVPLCSMARPRVDCYHKLARFGAQSMLKRDDRSAFPQRSAASFQFDYVTLILTGSCLSFFRLRRGSPTATPGPCRNRGGRPPAIMLPTAKQKYE
jgi:hypothetical protein